MGTRVLLPTIQSQSPSTNQLGLHDGAPSPRFTLPCTASPLSPFPSPLSCSPCTDTASGLGLPLPQNSPFTQLLFLHSNILSAPGVCVCVFPGLETVEVRLSFWMNVVVAMGKKMSLETERREAADGTWAVETADLTKAGLLTHWAFCGLASAHSCM